MTNGEGEMQIRHGGGAQTARPSSPQRRKRLASIGKQVCGRLIRQANILWDVGLEVALAGVGEKHAEREHTASAPAPATPQEWPVLTASSVLYEPAATLATGCSILRNAGVFNSLAVCTTRGW